ncbi:hypothetical protein DMC30DRAFT_404953 [Rhodotorula diobovata]|uniref:Uncharacterized protein n=1 Tax=Rhodotorula diobovata TaxID=5288 RepID=A0A5C5FNI0_9BASI|nr:hypothetical protein DMC30DRAFT_404953 [Rhodotorula diobovata]
MSALPSSTSESHLVRVQRAPLPPKPPAQPTKVRPFILRGTSSSTAAQSRPAAGRAADHAQGDKTGHDVGALKKSKTSVDVAVHAESTRSSESSRADKDRRRRTAAVRSDFGMTSTIEKGTAADFDAGGRRVGLTRSPPMPSSSTTASTSSSAPRRPISLAASSLRALSSTSSDTHPSPTPRARPLSYVSSATTNTTSPPRRRPLSFSASPSPPNKVRPSSSASIGAAPRAPPVISPTRARALSPAASAAVEAHKAALKRRMLAARRQGADVSDTVAPAEPEQGATQGGMRRSGRWFGRLASASNGDENASLEAGSQEERSDAALTSGRSTVGGRRSVDGLRMAGGRPPTTPPVRGLGKKASLTALGRGHVRPEPVVEPSPVRVVEDETGPGFSSLQDVRVFPGPPDLGWRWY